MHRIVVYLAYRTKLWTKYWHQNVWKRICTKRWLNPRGRRHINLVTYKSIFFHCFAVKHIWCGCYDLDLLTPRPFCRFTTERVLIERINQPPTIPANTACWNNDVLMLAQRLRRWPNIKTSLVQRVVFAGMDRQIETWPCVIQTW